MEVWTNKYLWEEIRKNAEYHITFTIINSSSTKELDIEYYPNLAILVFEASSGDPLEHTYFFVKSTKEAENLIDRVITANGIDTINRNHSKISSKHLVSLKKALESYAIIEGHEFNT